MKNIKVGELEVPSDYFSLPQEDKDVICNSILESIMYLLEKHVDNEYFNRKMVLERIIESSIIS